jgi:hypothetical protein
MRSVKVARLIAVPVTAEDLGTTPLTSGKRLVVSMARGEGPGGDANRDVGVRAADADRRSLGVQIAKPEGQHTGHQQVIRPGEVQASLAQQLPAVRGHRFSVAAP